MEPRVLLNNAPEHLCFTCKYVPKCRRRKEIYDRLLEVEADALEKWKLDVNVSYLIRECDQYSVNWDVVQSLSDQLMMEDEIDDDGEEEV